MIYTRVATKELDATGLRPNTHDRVRPVIIRGLAVWFELPFVSRPKIEWPWILS